MSNEVFPDLPGVDWGTEKEPQFDTRTVRAVSGYEVRLSRRAYPLYSIKMKFNFLRTAAAYQELQQVIGLFLRHKGSGDSFLLYDPDDGAVTNQSFGVGTGSAKTFSLAATWGGFVQPVRNIKAITAVKVNGTSTTAYTLNADGTITFTTAPASGAVLTWTGQYYYRCRFSDDQITAKEMMQGIWELQRCELIGGLGRQMG